MLRDPTTTINEIAPQISNTRNCFAFFIHPTDEADSLHGLRVAFPGLNEDDLKDIMHWVKGLGGYRVNAEPVCRIESIHSLTGIEISGWLIFSSLTAKEMISLDSNARQVLLNSYIQSAISCGANYIGLGAYVSILSKAGRYLQNQKIPITSGNSYTAMCSLESMRQFLHQRKQRESDKSVAIVGAYGSIGRLLALKACQRFGKVILIGNAANKRSQRLLLALADELIHNCLVNDYEYEGCVANKVQCCLERAEKISSTVSYEKYKQLCESTNEELVIEIAEVKEGQSIGVDVVFSATSNAGSFLTHTELAGCEAVCDISRPTDMNPYEIQNNGIVYIEGGLSELPETIHFGGENLQGFPGNINLGCLSETMALTMEGVRNNHSIGDSVSLNEMNYIFEICLKHGFKPYLKKYGEQSL